MLFAIVITFTAGSVALTYLLGRAMWRGVKQLTGAISGRKALPGTPQDPTQPARDVVVEPVDSGKGVWREPAPAPKTAGHGDYVRLDIDEGTTSSDIVRVMRRYIGDEVLGGHARMTIANLESASLRRASLFPEIDDTFQRGTLSWDKFATPASAAFDAILRNSAQLGNRIQSFDTASYLHLKETMGLEWRQTGETSTHSKTREKRWELYKEMLASLDALQEANESLLLELDKLAAEVTMITGAESDDQCDDIIEEIRRLVEEAKYYRQ